MKLWQLQKQGLSGNVMAKNKHNQKIEEVLLKEGFKDVVTQSNTTFYTKSYHYQEKEVFVKGVGGKTEFTVFSVFLLFHLKDWREFNRHKFIRKLKEFYCVNCKFIASMEDTDDINNVIAHFEITTRFFCVVEEK